MMSCSRACVLSSPRALALSCSHALMLSGSPAVMPSCSRASKLSYRKESGNALLFFLWLLVSSSLTPSPALSLSQAKEYAPSVTRFPFLLVQVFKIVLPPRRNAHFQEVKGFLHRRLPQELPKSSQDTSKSSPRRPKSCQRGSKRILKTLQEHQKRSHSLIALSFHRLMLSYSDSLIVS